MTKARPARSGGAVVDLFCGIGGFSEGARRASKGKWRTRLAIDNWQRALDVHSRQHKRCHHRCMELGTSESARYVTRKIKRLRALGYKRIHLHGSPPCTRFSAARFVCHNRQATTQQDAEEGMGLVRWFLELAAAADVTSWTMENVIQCRPFLPQVPASIVLRSSECGGYSNRRRLFVGTFDPLLVGVDLMSWRPIRACLMDAPESETAVLCDRSWKRNGNQQCPFGRTSSLDAPAPSITCTGRLDLVDDIDGEYRILRRLVRKEYMRMHNIGNYAETGVSMRMIGNMVLPECAQAIVEAL